MAIFSTPRSTRRRTATLTASAALVLSALGAVPLVAQSASAAAPTLNSTSVYGNSTKVISSTGHRLLASFYASKSSSSGGGNSLGVTLRTRTGHESHAWSFGAPDSVIALTSRGSGTVTLSATKMGGYGRIKLHVQPVAKATTQMCSGQLVSRTRKVSVSGIFHFVTKSKGGHKWGAVGSTRKTFTFHAPNYVTWYYDNTGTCPTPPPTTPTCSSSLTWSASHSTTAKYVSLNGGTYAGHSSVSGYRSVQLTKPAGARRTDYVTSSSKAPRLTVKPNNSASLKATLGQGSATLAGKGTRFTTPCGDGSRLESIRSWNGSYTNGRTPLKVPAQIYGALQLKNMTTGGYFSQTRVL